MTMLKIDAEFERLIPPLSDSEAAELEASILADGCREALYTWQGVIVDGHNRHRICAEHDIEYRTQVMEFDSRDAVIDWMLRNQLGRRNLSKDSFKLLLGTLYNRRKQQIGGQLRRPQNEDAPVRTVDQVAGEFGVGSSTVERAGQYVNNLDTLGESISPEAREALAVGIKGITDKDVSELAKDEEAQQTIVEYIDEGCEPAEAVKSAVESKKKLAAGRSLVDDDEWNTPDTYIESVRKVLGDIDIDPASNDAAQQIVDAGEYFTKDNSGLADGVEWHGRAFMNPPYSDPLCGEFCDKMIAEYRAGHVTEAIVLINATTDTRYFHALISASVIECITRGRIGFVKGGIQAKNNSKGQVFFYFGNNPDAFASEFLQHGLVYKGECY